MSILTQTEVYAKAVLIGLDDTGDALLGVINDVTISAQCGVAKINAMRGMPLTDRDQKLLTLYAILNGMEHGHCEGAVLGDIDRALDAVSYLTPVANYIKDNKIPAAYP
jgi:ATP-dependent RNA circularization protein (DNA/RNA ligase family)